MREKRALDKEFSRQWIIQNCTLERRIKDDYTCNGYPCHNGACEMNIVDVEGFGPGLFERCVCDEGWLGMNCDVCCDMPCQNNGTCQYTMDRENQVPLPYCNCAFNQTSNMTGPLCEDLKNTTMNIEYRDNTITSWEIPLIVSTVLIVLLAVALFTTLYVMYKKRHPWLVKVLVQYHTRHIDDSNRRYDVFLSYQSNAELDRKFVVYKLLPMLEQEGYTVCIDQRDFIPGAAIANVISDAIQESKRTILVLSPAYVSGDWQEFEIQCALRESLKKNHRIIPVLFEPIKDEKEEISNALAHILESITYIEWSEDKEKDFVKRLKIALPKHAKDKQCTNEHSFESQRSIPSQEGLIRPSDRNPGRSRNLFSKAHIQSFVARFKSSTVHPQTFQSNTVMRSHPSVDFAASPSVPPQNLNIPLNNQSFKTNQCEESKVQNEDIDCDEYNNVVKSNDSKYVALKMVC